MGIRVDVEVDGWGKRREERGRREGGVRTELG
jgi:hypothetical protein